MFRTCTLILSLAALLIGITGCAPNFQNPLSDGETSQLDERLIGYWLVDEMQSERATNLSWVLIVGRTNGKPDRLEVVKTELDEKDRVSVFRMPLLTKLIGRWGYLSCPPDKDEESGKYTIVRYRFINDGRLQIYDVDKVVLSKAVEEQRLAGRVTRTPTTMRLFGLIPITSESVTLDVSATSKELEAYFMEHGDKCFLKKPSVVFRRLNF